MKRSIFGFAAAGIILSGCMKNDVTVSDKDSSNIIKLETTTTRTKAAVTQGSTLQDDANGFKVYATSNGSAVWYSGIDGTNNHVYAGGNWGWAGTQVEWPIGSGYPMTFYAWFPATIAATSATTSNLAFDFSVPALSSAQVDVVAGKVSTGIKPPDGTLPIPFNHILSKVNFDVKAATGYKAYIQALGVVNVAGSGKYDAIGGSWSNNTNFNASFNYFGDFTPAVSAKTPAIFPGAGFNGAESMMLMPQAPLKDWKPSNGAPTDEAYVQLLYRLENGGPNDVGYASASSHDDYNGSALKTAGYTGPLFVLAGYPYASEWKKGNGYTYTIAFPGTTGGYLVDVNYYDDKGNRTDLSTGKQPGDPVYDVDLTIRLIPDVNAWYDTPAQPVMDLEGIPNVPLSNQLKNTKMPFDKGDYMPDASGIAVDRYYKVVDWKYNQAALANGNVDMLKGGTLVLIAYDVWGVASITNGKLYQTVRLEAGAYEFDVLVNETSPQLQGTVYAVAALGEDLPNTNDVEQDAKTLDFASIPAGVPRDNVHTLTLGFVLSKESIVSLGFVATILPSEPFPLVQVHFREVILRKLP